MARANHTPMQGHLKINVNLFSVLCFPQLHKHMNVTLCSGHNYFFKDNMYTGAVFRPNWSTIDRHPVALYSAVSGSDLDSFYS
jgi:hypothetical protein